MLCSTKNNNSVNCDSHFQTICLSLIIKYMNLQEINRTHLFYFFGSFPKVHKLWIPQCLFLKTSCIQY
jgi:hypothetical protein